MFEVDFNRMLKFHKEHKALVTLFTHPNSHPYDSGLIVANEKSIVEEWLTKEDSRPQWYKNRVNAGLHIIDPSVLDMLSINEDDIGREINGKVVKVDLDRQIFKNHCVVKVLCYATIVPSM